MQSIPKRVSPYLQRKLCLFGWYVGMFLGGFLRESILSITY